MIRIELKTRPIGARKWQGRVHYDRTLDEARAYVEGVKANCPDMEVEARLIDDEAFRLNDGTEAIETI